MLEPTQALESTENALRLIVRQLLGDAWQNQVTPERVKQFEARMVEEAKRRDGVKIPQDLLAFTDFTDLTNIIGKKWEVFKPVFDDRARLMVYFDFYQDIRNTIAHSRALVDYERELLSGMTKHIRNQVALFRMGENPASKYYPVIESATDSLGNEGNNEYPHLRGDSTGVRLNVGDTIIISCRASDPQQRNLHWVLATGSAVVNGFLPGRSSEDQQVTGEDIRLEYTVTEQDYGESFELSVFMFNESEYRRSKSTTIGGVYSAYSVDDSRYFRYAVNPPIYASPQIEAEGRD